MYAADREFHSFKKVISEMGAPYNTMEMASFMSCSKGELRCRLGTKIGCAESGESEMMRVKQVTGVNATKLKKMFFSRSVLNYK